MQIYEKRSKKTKYDYMVEGLKSSQAAVAGRCKPYHLQYAEQYRNNPILNPKLKGARHGTEVESRDSVKPAGIRRPEKSGRGQRRINRDLIGTVLTGGHRVCGPKAKACRGYGWNGLPEVWKYDD